MTVIARTRLLAAAVVVALAAVTVVAVAPSGAAPSASDGVVAAGWAGGWLAARVTADGSVHDALDHPSPGATLLTAVSLATARTEGPAFQRAVGWLAANVDQVTGTGASADPGQVGYLLLVVDAAGLDPTAFGGVDLPARLAGTLGQFEPGLYGQADPTYDGVFRQSLAILGLAAAGEPQAGTALTWLTDQQCGGVDPATTGGWEAYRALATPCTAPDLGTFTGPDTNSTAMAFEALVAAHVTPGADALGWLARAQNSTGGWGFLPGLGDDPNSTGLVVQAIVAGGQSPTSGVWVHGANSALSALLTFQLGCDRPVADRGAFRFPGGGTKPDQLATEQGTWGAGQRAFPLGPVTFGATPDPCAPAPTTTTTAAPTTSVTTNPAGAAPAGAVEATPAFTG